MRTSRLRKSAGFLVAAELTIAAQVLLFLPAPAYAARPAESSVKEETSGETALAALKIERGASAPQEPVEVNKTVPEVEPPPQYPTFSPIPTDAELTRARVFGEPLIPEAGETNDAENQALAQAITTYLYGGDSEALEPLEGVVTAFPRSRFRVAVQANVGSWYRRKGYFTRAQRNLTEAWRLGKSSDTEGVRRLAEFAAGELMQLHMQFGQVDPLEALVTEFQGRELSGGITEKLAAARATVWGLRSDHENAIPSGSVALERIRQDRHEKKERSEKEKNPDYRKKAFERSPVLDTFPATHDGASLAEIADLADASDLELQMARRISPEATIPLPAVVHLKQGHFAAVVEERNGRYRLDDPLLGGEVWLSTEAFQEETSGFFLLEEEHLPPAWRAADRGEAEPVRGKCVYAVPGDGNTRENDLKKGGFTAPGNPYSPVGGTAKSPPYSPSCPRGLCGYTLHLSLASVRIQDNPVGYSPPYGPSVRFHLAHNQREANQPTTFYYSNLGQRWVHNWMSYVEDDPTAVGEPVELYVRGGGREPYEGFVNGISAPQQDVRAVMTIISTSPMKYERELPDGSKEVFAESDGAASAPRRIFLSELVDPHGNKLVLTYDGQLRLVSMTDAIDQVTTLSYELPSDPLKITKVTDPFGRSATIEYDDEGRLIRITDVIGMASELEYNATDFIRALTTPYGTTTFRTGNGPYNTQVNRWIEATDPLGGTERVEQLLNNAPLSSTDSANTVPTGFTGNNNLDTHASVFYTKLAMDRATSDPPDPTTGYVTRWRSSSQLKLSGYQVQSTKAPLEGRIWYEHVGETIGNGVGPDGRPSMIGRVLDDGSAQITRYEYNSRGGITHETDPVGRETVYEYAANEQELLKIKQRQGADYVLIEEMAYDSAHNLVTTIDASLQTTTYTYNSTGQILTSTTPARAGIVENRTTTYTYDANGYLQTVTRPMTGATTTYTYDISGRPQTVANSDSYVLTFDYDALDRRTKVAYPDSTYEETVYQRLDAVRSRDRLGRWTNRVYDALRRAIATTDPLGRTVTLQWCGCGILDAVIDGNGNVSRWERDLQGRVTKEIRANASEWLYAYESTTSRLKTITDPKMQVKTYDYFDDDNLASINYADEEYATHDVSFSYDLAFDRLATMVDGTGTTTYAYYPIGVPHLGAGSLSSVDGPLSSDTIRYSYDELGRVASQAVNDVAVSYQFDELGRITTETNVLGSFSLQYDGVTSRLQTVTYPNGQTAAYAYYSNSDDHRLREIHHRKSGGATLSRFNYTYDAVGNIETWTQQQDGGTAKVYHFEYDLANQLRAALLQTTDPVPSVLRRYNYTYDPAGNRTVEQVDDSPSLFQYDNMNRVTSQQSGGTLRFAGRLNEAAVVTIQGFPSVVNDDDEFSGGAQVGPGTNVVVIRAKDYTDNERTDTYEVEVAGSATTFTFDANGNMTGDGTRTFEWDAENRLVAVDEGAQRSEFFYDGQGRRTGVVEIYGGLVTSESHFVWCGLQMCEERDSGSTVTKRFLRHGVQIGSDALFYTTDHLRSVWEVTDLSNNIRAQNTYDPFGRPTKLSEEVDVPVGFARQWVHGETGLAFARYRVYDASLGRWLSQDPIGLRGGLNLYRYARNIPTSLVDPSGLQPLRQHDTIDEAGIAGLRIIAVKCQTLQHPDEYAGAICRLCNGKFIAEPEQLVKSGDEAPSCKSGEQVGFYHCHTKGGAYPDFFSLEDNLTLLLENWVGYLVTPRLAMKKSVRGGPAEELGSAR